jgi:phytoene desaturase
VVAGGGRFEADAVVANADAETVYRRLLPEGSSRRRRERATSGFVLLLGVRGDFPQLAHHTVFFSDDYPREFRQLFRDRVPLDRPTVYVCCPSGSVPRDAPPGQSALFVMANAPAGAPADAWDDAAGYGDLLIERLEACGLEDLARRIVLRREFTPRDFEREYGAPGGTIYGAVSHGQRAVLGRQPNRDPAIPNLYFAGGSAHPGGGVPIVLLSGRIVARLVLSDFHGIAAPGSRVST